MKKIILKCREEKEKERKKERKRESGEDGRGKQNEGSRHKDAG